MLLLRLFLPWRSCKCKINVNVKANDETNIVNEHSNWREADQLAIYKHERGVELGFTEKQLLLSGQSGIWTCDLRISSLAP